VDQVDQSGVQLDGNNTLGISSESVYIMPQAIRRCCLISKNMLAALFWLSDVPIPATSHFHISCPSLHLLLLFWLY